MVEVCRALVLAENQIGSAEARGVGEHVDLDDLAASILEPKTTRGRPPGAHTVPALPSTNAGRANRWPPEKVPTTAT